MDALNRAGDRAVAEAKVLQSAGFDGVIVENLGDLPFYASSVPPITISSMSVIVAAVRDSLSIPVGVNVLRNDARSALSIASILDCEWIRVNVLSGVVASDQGWIEGQAAELIRERSRIGADSVKILADVFVKHAQTFSSTHKAQAIEDAVLRGGADGVVISGSGTGKPVDLTEVGGLARVAQDCGVGLWIGSGANVENVRELALHCGGRHAGGILVSSALRAGGRAGQPLESKRIKDWLKAARGR